MPYVERDAKGAIISLHRNASALAAEFLPDDDFEVRAFVGANDASFEQLDADFVRVIEDLIDALILKNVVNITDLPEQAQAKLLARKRHRERISKQSLQLFAPPTDFGDVI